MIQATPTITTKAMAERLGISKRMVISLINKLKEDGILRRVGSTRTGHWQLALTHRLLDEEEMTGMKQGNDDVH